MAQPLQELASLLHSLQSLKAPGVSKSKVDAITKLCTSQNPHVDRAQIVDVIVHAFKSSAPTHKLGVMYCADSVIRQWIAQGGNNVGVERLTAHIPSLMEDLLASAPEDQKVRIIKLIDIWLGSKTFAADMLNSYKQRLSTSTQAVPGTQPPATANPMNGQAYPQHAAVAPPTSVSMPSAVGTPSTLSQAQFQAPNLGGFSQQLATLQSPPVNTQTGNTQPQPPPAMPFVQPQAAAPVVIPPTVANVNQAAVAQNSQAPPLPALNPTQLQAVQAVVSANPSITAEQLMTLLSAMGVQIPTAAPAYPGQAPPQPTAPASVAPAPQNQYGPPGQDPQAYQRDRSRSPDYKRRRVTPPNRRESPTYGVYDPNAAKSSTPRGGGGDGNESDRRDRGRGKHGRDNYRKRSPPRERLASPSLMGLGTQLNVSKPYGYDNTLPNGKIRVLSRTLFVGGVSASASEEQLMDYIARFVRVQSCIVNHDKRHAFLKCITHQDAINAKAAVEQRPESEYRHLFERINWAVGFGPTKYADYQKGESVLPIDVLTDADRKWMKSAEYGGTGGLDIKTGMVVEEPDIEIGAGPSSKAISRRGGKSGYSSRSGNDNHGGGSKRDRGNRGGHHDDQKQGGFKQDRQPPPAPPMETHLPEPVNIGPPPPVPQFGGLPFPIPQLP
ncbi:hypothetical protein, variant [Verruconis gallopava]|uniref:CID domain-containing protein n=1 Tax=Verruconis gallopava TaxID=253628 RepID=A0A0D1ZWV5_9PEZI|nr:hypothetical protein, variant [Verruconis gallopava]KIV98484.1 hypothetical protein, variant [Verruconis gallopava]